LTIVKHDKYAPVFYDDLKYCRERIYAYHQGKVSYFEMLGSVAAFCFRNVCRAWRGSIVSKEFLNLGNIEDCGTGIRTPTKWFRAIFQSF
jgi:hypothetical protein